MQRNRVLLTSVVKCLFLMQAGLNFTVINSQVFLAVSHSTLEEAPQDLHVQAGRVPG